jgi:hypothetical protein
LSAKDSLVTRSPAVDQSAITRAVTVAGGRFAPGHLGELTQQVPFEMVDAVLEETRRTQRRVRVLPSRVVVYLLLAGCLFAELGYGQVWGRVAAGLGRAAGGGPDRGPRGLPADTLTALTGTLPDLERLDDTQAARQEADLHGDTTRRTVQSALCQLLLFAERQAVRSEEPRIRSA